MERGVACGSGTLCSTLALQLPGQLYDPKNILELNFLVHKAILHALPHLLLMQTLPIEQTLLLMSLFKTLHWPLVLFRIKSKIFAVANKALCDPVSNHLSKFIPSFFPFALSVLITLAP